MTGVQFPIVRRRSRQPENTLAFPSTGAEKPLRTWLACPPTTRAELTATVTATATTSGRQQRPPTAPVPMAKLRAPVASPLASTGYLPAAAPLVQAPAAPLRQRARLESGFRPRSGHRKWRRRAATIRAVSPLRLSASPLRGGPGITRDRPGRDAGQSDVGQGHVGFGPFRGNVRHMPVLPVPVRDRYRMLRPAAPGGFGHRAGRQACDLTRK
jgi:hypothetical protein